MKINNYPHILTGLDVKITLGADFKGNSKGTEIASGKLNIQPFYYKEAIVDYEKKDTKIKIVSTYKYIFTSLTKNPEIQNIEITHTLLNGCDYPNFKNRIGLELEFNITGNIIDITEDNKAKKYSEKLLNKIIKHIEDKLHQNTSATIDSTVEKSVEITEQSTQDVKKKLNNK